MLTSYMQNNPPKADALLPIANLKGLGCDLSILPPGAKIFDPKEMLQGMGVENVGDNDDSEVADGADEDGEGGDKVGSVAREEQTDGGGEQPVPTNPIEGTSDAP